MADSDTDTSTGGFTSSAPSWSDLAPEWVKDLGKYSDFLISFAKDPVGWLRRNLVGILLGGLFAGATALTEFLRSPLLAVEESLIYVGESAAKVPLFLGGTAVDVAASLDQVYMAAGSAAGPFGVILYPVLWIGTLTLLARILWGVADSIPGVSSIQKFLEGFG